MKKSFMAFIAAGLLLAGTGCKKNDSSDTTVASASSMSATIGSAAWKATSMSAKKDLVKNTMTITGKSSDGNIVTLVTSGTTAQAYSFANTASFASYNTYSTVSSFGTGTITLSKVDNGAKKVSGSFFFATVDNAFSPVTVQQGLFTDVVFTETSPTTTPTTTPTVTPTGTSGSVSASINGTAFSASGSYVSVNNNFVGYTITALSGSSAFTFSLTKPTTVSTDTQGLINAVYYSEGSNLYNNTAQSVSILSYDGSTRRVVGSFSLTATSNGVTKTVTNGSFSFIAN